MELPYFFGIFVLLLGGGFAWSVMKSAKRRANWAVLAESLGLDHLDDILVGMLDGFLVTVSVEQRGSGKSRHEVTVFKTDIEANLPAGMAIVSEGIISKVTKMFGAEDIQLGLAELDPKLMIQAQNADEVREWARRENVRLGLGQLSKLTAFRLQDETLSFEIRGALADTDQVRMKLQELVSIAALISPEKIQDEDDLVLDGADDAPDSGDDEDVLW
jgi:hypothetical protein